MKKLLTSLALAALALTASADTVKIGVILPLSGNNANMGETLKPALDLFKKEVASAKYHHDYQLIIEDDQMTSRLTAQAANKLINIDHVDAIVTWTSGPSHVVAPIATTKRIPHIAICADPLVSSSHPYSFNRWINPSTTATGLVKLLERMNKKNIVILSPHQQGMKAILDDMKPELSNAGIRLLDEQYFNPGERDFRMMLTRIREQHPDAVVPLAFPPEIEIILRQAKQMGLDVPMPSEAYDFVKDMSLIEGQYNVSCSRGTPEFRAHIQTTINHDTDYAVPFLYDALNFIRAAYEASPTVDHAAAAKFLTNLKDYPSAVGLVSTDSDRFIDSPATYYKISHGQIVPVTLDQIH